MRKLTLAFDSAEAFQREYATNLANGGAFVATDGAFSLRDRVRVCLVLKPTGGRVELDAEVVHIVTPEMVQMGGPAGVAVQFEGSVNTVRAQLEPLRSAAGAPEHRPPDAGRRRSPRTEARVAARVKAKGIDVSGHTRNLSQTGVLVAVGGKAVPVGQRVKLSLTHPNSAEVMRVAPT